MVTEASFITITVICPERALASPGLIVREQEMGPEDLGAPFLETKDRVFAQKILIDDYLIQLAPTTLVLVRAGKLVIVAIGEQVGQAFWTGQYVF